MLELLNAICTFDKVSPVVSYGQGADILYGNVATCILFLFCHPTHGHLNVSQTNGPNCNWTHRGPWGTPKPNLVYAKFSWVLRWSWLPQCSPSKNITIECHVLLVLSAHACSSYGHPVHPNQHQALAVPMPVWDIESQIYTEAIFKHCHLIYVKWIINQDVVSSGKTWWDKSCGSQRWDLFKGLTVYCDEYWWSKMLFCIYIFLSPTIYPFIHLPTSYPGQSHWAAWSLSQFGHKAGIPKLIAYSEAMRWKLNRIFVILSHFGKKM